MKFEVGNLATTDTRGLSTHWDNYRHFLAQDGFPYWDLETKEDTELAIGKFRDALLLSFAKASTPRSTRVDYYKLPTPIRDLITERNNVRRDWQSSRDPGLKTQLNRLNSRIRSEIRAHSCTRFNEYVASLSASDCSIWTAARRIKNRGKYTPVLKTNNFNAVTDAEKAEVIANSLKHQFEPNHDVISIRKFSVVIPRVQEFIHSEHSLSLVHTSPSEILEYTTKLHKGKSPGIDNISTNMLKFLPYNYLVFLALLFNRLLDLGSFPDCWKEALVVPIHKPGSDSTNPINYRPISLLSCLSKVYEFVLAKRLDAFLQNNNIIRPEQMGFRSQLSTQHQLWRVTELIHGAREKRHAVVAVFIDIAKAFDKIWHDGLLFKLININCPPQLIMIINSYLSNRTFKVRVGKSVSSPFNISSGVPQGSLLGPKLFNIYINDMPSMPKIDLALYADDTAIICTGKGLPTVYKSLRNYLKLYEIWLRNWRIKVNTDKCAAVYFSNKYIPTSTNLTLNGGSIPWTTKYKYLGVYLDSKLTWRPQIDDLVRKSRAAHGSLGYLLKRSSRLSMKSKLLLYTAFIRPVMTYGSMIWGCTAITNLQRLQVFQNTILKICTNCEWYVRMDTIHRDLRIRPILPQIKKLAWKFHRGIPLIQNPCLHGIPAYDSAYSRSAKRPRALLNRPDISLPPSKRPRRERS